MMAPATPALTTVRGFQNPAVAVGSGSGSGCVSSSSSGSGSGDVDVDSDKALGPMTPRLSATNRPSTPTSQRRGRFPVDDVISANCSPLLRPQPSPAMSGITKLRLRMDEPLSLDACSRSSSLSRHASRCGLNGGLPMTRAGSRDGASSEFGSDEGSTSYEIDLQQDFVDESVRGPGANGGSAPPSYGAVEGGLVANRKMTAEDFEPLRCLGKGSYGTVLLVKQRGTGRLYAQKQFKKASLVVHKKLVEQTKTERQILESVNQHPFVVKLYYAFQDHEKLYLILEYGQGGELFTHLDSERMFSESVAAFYMAEMILAISHLHDNLGVVYRDLKPENCLLDAEGHLLLTDFGLSKVSTEPTDSCNSILGTVEYMALEVILGKKYGRPADWWSFGALAYDLMTGTPPFRGGNNAKIQDNIVKQKLYLPYFLSPDAKDLLTRLMRKDPAKRLGGNMPRDLDTVRRHRVFRNIDWKKLEARELEPPIQPLITDPELAENFSRDFTDLSMSPVVTSRDPWSAMSPKEDLFGGFSFVAPPSLLERDGLAVAMAT